MSVNLLLQKKNSITSGFADNWFEVTEELVVVVENDDNDNNDENDNATAIVISRVGLYVDQDEADLGCSTRQMIADRNGNHHLTFKVNKISAESLL